MHRPGDRNTKFFHKAANIHRHFNFMSSVVVDGVCFDVLQDMKYAIHASTSPCLLSLNLRDLKLMDCPCPLYGTLVGRSMSLTRKKLRKLFLIAMGIRLLDRMA